MPKGWFVRLSLVVALSLALAPAASAQNGKLKKAEKMLAKYAGSDTVALAKAYDSIAKAKDHPKTRDLAQTWVVLAEVHLAYARDPEAQSPVPDAEAAAVAAYDAAVGKDADKAYAERILEGAAAIEAMAQARATEAFESKQYDVAWPALQNAMAAQKVVRQVGRLDEARAENTLKIAVLTAVKRNDLKAARELHTALGGPKAPAAVSLALATALADVEGPEVALAFLAPLSDADPSNAELLGARIDYLFVLERPEEVRELLLANAGSLGKALAITLLHARAWDRVGDLAKAAEAYAKAMELGPEDQRVLRGYADVELRRASAFDLAAGATRKWRERKDLRSARDEARERSLGLLMESRRLAPEHLATLVLLRELHDDLRTRDREVLSELDQTIERLRDAEVGEPE